MDYFSVLAFQYGKSHFLNCMETLVRQTVSKSQRHSIKRQQLIKSFAMYSSSWKHIIVCGTHRDVDSTCVTVNGKYTTHFSSRHLPAEPAIVELR